MVFKFGTRSMVNLGQTHSDLQAVMNEAITRSPLDFGITCGGRTLAEQSTLFAQKKTRTMKSKHLPCLLDESRKIYVSGAVDIVAIDPDSGKYSWESYLYHQLYLIIREVADELSTELRWGGDWDRDGDTTDQSFNDLPHFELWSGKYVYDFSKLNL